MAESGSAESELGYLESAGWDAEAADIRAAVVGIPAEAATEAIIRMTPATGAGERPVEPPKLTLRWESALPIREAELRSRDVDAPTVDEKHYAIAVVGVPRNMIKADTRAMESDLKKQAFLKRDDKKDLKPSSVEILQRDDGPVIVFFFPRSTEITPSDRRVEFDAQIGRLKFAEPFYLEDMVYQGKLAL